MKKEALTAPALEALLEAPSLAILAVDIQGCVILWSPSASRMFGWTESEVLGRFLPLVPEEHRQEVYDRIQRELKGEIISPLDVRRLRKDGSLVDVSLWTAPLRDSTGEVIGILALYADITARKRAEGALKQTAAELSRVLAAVSDCLYSGEFDSDGRLTYHYYSPAAERILGRPPLFFLAGPDRWLRAVHPEDRPRVVQAFAQLRSGRWAAADEEYRIVLPDGTIRWVRDSVTLTQGMDGRHFVNGVVSDITARKQSEEVLQQSKAELQEVLAAVSDYIWSGQFNPDGQFSYRYNSPAVERILGRPVEFFLAGQGRWLSTVHPEDRPRVAQALDRLQTGQSASEHEEYRIVLPDGAIRWVRESVAASQSADGRRCLSGVVTDIAARRQAEAALRDSEARFRGIFTAAAAGIALVSPEGRFLHANPAFCKFIGYSEQELFSKSVQDVTHSDDRERTAEIRRGIWEGKKSLIRSYETRYLRKDGQTVWGAVSISLIRDGMGNANYSVTEVLDITERKRAEMALQATTTNSRAQEKTSSPSTQ
jgi:PAS domain S-box-containing protein